MLLNISQTKGTQTMTFGPLKEYLKRNIFLNKIMLKWGRKASSRPLFLKKKLYIS